MSFPKFKLITLKNRMRVLCIPIKNSHTIGATVNIDSGFFEETKSENGLAHYLEHIIAKHLMKKSIIEQLQKKNIYFDTNATTNMFRTNYRIYGDAKHADIIVKQLLEMYNFSEEDLDIDVFKKEKVAVIVELKKILSNTDRLASFQHIPELMFGKRSKLINNVSDEIKSVRTFKPKDLFKFIEKHYVPEKTVITLSGKFDQAKLLKYIENNVPDRKMVHKIQKRVIPIKKIYKPQYLYIKDTGKSLYNVKVSFFCPTINQPKEVGKINLLKKILTGIGDLSILKHRLRTKLGTIYSISAFTEYSKYYGVFTISYSVEIQNFFKTLNEIMIVLKEMKESLFNPKLVKIAKQRYLLNIKNILNSNNPSNYYDFSNNVLNNQELINVQEYYDKYVKNVEKTDIVKICKKIFNKDNVYMCNIGHKPLKEESIINTLSKI